MLLQLVLACAGAALVATGVAMVSVPLALILSGASCLGAALFLVPEVHLPRRRKGQTS